MREYRLIRDAIDAFGLDLSGKVVLTEAASNEFLWTPIIAGMARASRVIAVGRDSCYGSFRSVKRQTLMHAQRLGIAECLQVVSQMPYELLEKVDIVTNLGFVRPIDARLIRALNQRSIICLMWEPWEFRDADIDLRACRKRGIAVLGTNEKDPRVATLDYLALSVMKALLEQKIEIKGSRILLLGMGEFVDTTEDSLRSNGASVWRCACRQQLPRKPWDCVVCLEHHDLRKCLIGARGVFSRRDVVGDSPLIIHVCGRIDVDYIHKMRWQLIPNIPARPGFMSFTTASVGARPVIDLHAAGLKIGQAFLDGDHRALKALSKPLALKQVEDAERRKRL